jgi:hypothetical protein
MEGSNGQLGLGAWWPATALNGAQICSASTTGTSMSVHITVAELCSFEHSDDCYVLPKDGTAV